MTPTGVVLAGGSSRRMGEDKALIAFDGVALAARVRDALAAAGCDPVVCQGGDAEGLARLGLRVVADTRPGSGPLPAILDALAAAAPADVVISACDLPRLDASTVTTLREVADDNPDADVVVAGEGGRPQLLGMWRARSLPRLAALVEEGVRAHRTALQRLDAVIVEVPPGPLANVNRPEDLRRHR